jgi:hypothetical protein
VTVAELICWLEKLPEGLEVALDTDGRGYATDPEVLLKADAKGFFVLIAA